ncbi:MAG: TerC family protein, partial [Bacteroidota bacterium]|nr:TerC family protein [Bacteroidota bacterium]
MPNSVYLWVGFNLFIFTMLCLDLFVFNRKAHTIKVKEALLWTAFWVSLAIIFGLGIWYYQGVQLAKEFFTGYLIEQSLSVDNLFVMLLIFTVFRTPTAFQHKVLFWGIIGVVLMRILFILVGVALIEKFHWMTYLLGGFLIFTGIKMLVERDKEVHPDKNPVIRFFRKIMPVTDIYEGDKFFVKKDGRTWATPLFIVLLVIETTDIVFALDSIPAILAISTDPFIVYSSNLFAVLGLRSLYFALAGVMELFQYLKYGLSIILTFIGVKIMLANTKYEIDIDVALIVVAGILLLSVVISLLFPPKKMPIHHPV